MSLSYSHFCVAMVEILDTLVSLDLFKEFFCCDLSKCHGICCVEGDAGAPVTIDEITQLEEAVETLRPQLSPKALRQIDKHGVVYPDRDGELVTQIIDGRDCVFVKKDGPCAYCAIDAAYRKGLFYWQKPISCALYPVRLTQVGGMTAVNVHHWDVCQSARQLGKKLQLPLYQFLKEPLIRRFGQAWWDECEVVAKELKKAGYLD